MTAKAGLVGCAPCALVQPAPVKNPEQAKYAKIWEHPQYRQVAPGEHIAQEFLRQVRPNPQDTVIDFGAGTGRGALMLALFGRVNVTMVDFAPNCLDPDVRDCLVTQAHALRFVEADLTKPLPVAAKYGYCTDVLEHIPTVDIDRTLDNILKAAQHVFFQISLVDDALGALIGEPLHLTVKPFVWWLEKMREHEAVVHWSRNDGNSALFYVSAWNAASELVARGHVNTEFAEISGNVRSSVARGLQQCKPHDRQDTPVMILGGGPSLNDFEEEIIRRRKAGEILITTNGAYNWAVERGLTPSAQVVVDAREFNARFVQPALPGCKYLIASQCHPSVFDALPPEQVHVWHAGMTEELCDEIAKEYAARDEAWFPIPGGSTVMLRVFPLLRMLGFHRFEVFGFDSCLREKEHHAYEQTENDYERVLTVSCGGQVFRCHAWQASQAQECIDLFRMLGDEIDLIVRGDGLIHHIVQHAADLGELETREAA